MDRFSLTMSADDVPEAVQALVTVLTNDISTTGTMTIGVTLDRFICSEFACRVASQRETVTS